MPRIKFGPFGLPEGLTRLFGKTDLTLPQYGEQDWEVVPESEANLVTSATGKGDWHLPVLDLDIPHKYVPSTTEGHGHLYLDAPVRWDDYRALLETLGRLGILEQGYVRASVAKGATMVRKPGVKKTQAEIDAAERRKALVIF